jgi:hypothetical protein
LGARSFCLLPAFDIKALSKHRPEKQIYVLLFSEPAAHDLGTEMNPNTAPVNRFDIKRQAPPAGAMAERKLQKMANNRAPRRGPIGLRSANQSTHLPFFGFWSKAAT